MYVQASPSNRRLKIVARVPISPRFELPVTSLIWWPFVQQQVA